MTKFPSSPSPPVQSPLKRDKQWVDRLKEEYLALIKYIEINKKEENDWFNIESDKDGIKWTGKCWSVYEMAKYEFAFEFEVLSKDPSHLSPHSNRSRLARTRRQNRENVQGRKDLYRHSLRTSLAKTLPKIGNRPHLRSWRLFISLLHGWLLKFQI